MKVNGSVQPAELLFEHRFDGTAEMRFRENITSAKDDKGDTVYTYDEYFLSMPDRDGLEKIVQDNTEIWLAYAKKREVDKQAEIVREKRDGLLTDTDWTQTDDAPLADTDRESMRKYRQALRDITSQEEFPQSVTWPEKPCVTTVGGQSASASLAKQAAAIMLNAAQQTTTTKALQQANAALMLKMAGGK